MSFTAFFPLCWKPLQHQLLFIFIIQLFFSRVLNDFHVKLKKESLSRSVNSTAYLGIQDYEIFQKWPLCDFLIAKYISLGYFLQCRNSGQNPCLWRKEERWHQRSVRVSGKSRPPCPQTAVPLAGPPPGPVSVTVHILWHLAVRLFLLGVRRRLEFWVGIQHLPSNPATSGSHIPTRQATLPCLGFEPSVIIPSLL